MIDSKETLQEMTVNGVEVQEWINNDVEVYSGKVQRKYIVKFYQNANGGLQVNIKKYSMKDDSLISETALHYTSSNSYTDECIDIQWQSLTGGRWTFTQLVEGTRTIDGTYNNGTDYGGTANQIVPYSMPCTVTFITTDKYKA